MWWLPYIGIIGLANPTHSEEPRQGIEPSDPGKEKPKKNRWATHPLFFEEPGNRWVATLVCPTSPSWKKLAGAQSMS